jgi:hypothetical protein
VSKEIEIIQFKADQQVSKDKWSSECVGR